MISRGYFQHFALNNEATAVVPVFDYYLMLNRVVWCPFPFVTVGKFNQMLHTI